ncbi:hypothetical protein J3R82DRAFT_6797 [Butyriboletus roseoflavus]|nr:hypothetical protein J3R82DRAFT_6797 [Butyriboletus roseoflavus]
MLMNQILDSSNSLRDPDERSRPLKRSASVASLPTPPRTRHKRSRSRARSSLSHHDSDGSESASELDDDLGGGYAGRIKRAKTNRNNKSVSEADEHSEDESPDRKKRRTLGVLPGHDQEDENAFWTGRGASSNGEKQVGKVAQADKTEENSPSPAMLYYRVKAPVSPPPSRRLPSIQPARAASVERDGSLTGSAAPVTPPRRLFLRPPSPLAAGAFKTPTKPKVTKIWPKRDSPNNPFLIEANEKAELRSEWDSSDADEEVVGEARVREGTPTPTYEEKPTITYVFRGQKATFHNPLHGLAPEVIAASKLPLDHPDYEAAEACPPKRLFFSSGKRKSRDRSRESTSTEGVKRPKVQRSEDDHAKTSEGEQSGTRTVSHTKLPLAAHAETETVSPKAACEVSSRLVGTEEPQNIREGRERRETVAKTRLAPRDGLRAGAVFSERDEPARRAMGPPRSA